MKIQALRNAYTVPATKNVEIPTVTARSHWNFFCSICGFYTFLLHVQTAVSAINLTQINILHTYTYPEDSFIIERNQAKDEMLDE